MKMPEEFEPFMFAPCGMNCKVCYKHLAHKNSCGGCLKVDAEKPKHCRACKIKDCAKNKGVIYCFECANYPCKRINYLEQSYIKRYKVSLMENAGLVKECGIENFMRQQKNKYICAKCGGIISIHDKECSECRKSGED